MAQRTVLLTGGCGFIGRQAVPHLVAKGYRVHILGRSQGGDALKALRVSCGDAVEFHEVNLHDTDSVEPVVHAIRASHLLHLAWDTRHGIFWSSPDNLDWIVSSKLLLKSFIESGGQRAVAAGTSAEYDWESGEEAFEEGRSKLQPSTLYGQSKLAFRKSFFTLAAHHKISSAWGRIFFLFGPHEGLQRLVSSAAVSLLRGEPFDASIGDQLRDFSYAEDVAAAFVSLLDSNVTGDVNVASGEARSIASILDAIGAITGRPELIRLGAKPKLQNDPAHIVAVVRRLRDEVGVTFPRSLDERLAETVEWWRSNLSRP
jgi:nucleoside-diphosphate-sugar epimerase